MNAKLKKTVYFSFAVSLPGSSPAFALVCVLAGLAFLTCSDPSNSEREICLEGGVMSNGVEGSLNLDSRPFCGLTVFGATGGFRFDPDSSRSEAEQRKSAEDLAIASCAAYALAYTRCHSKSNKAFSSTF